MYALALCMMVGWLGLLCTYPVGTHAAKKTACSGASWAPPAATSKPQPRSCLPTQLCSEGLPSTWPSCFTHCSLCNVVHCSHTASQRSNLQARHNAALHVRRYAAVQNAALVVVSGGPRSGKSTLLDNLQAAVAQQLPGIRRFTHTQTGRSPDRLLRKLQRDVIGSSEHGVRMQPAAELRQNAALLVKKAGVPGDTHRILQTVAGVAACAGSGVGTMRMCSHR